MAQQVAEAPKVSSVLKPGEVDIDGIIISLPKGTEVEKIRSLALELMDLAELARKADRVITQRKGTVADAMLGIARKCAHVEEFDAAYNWVVIRYKARHAAKRMPTVYTQTASDVRRMFRQKVDLSAKTPEGVLLSYAALKTAANKSQRAQVARARDADEKAKPDWLKVYDNLTARVREAAIDPNSETYRESCEAIEQANEALQAIFAEWLKEHPVTDVSAVEEEEEGEETRPTRQPEPARAQA